MDNTNELGLDMVTVKLVNTGKLGISEKISTPNDAVRIMGDTLKDIDRECLCVINLKSDLTSVNCNIVSIGDIQSSLASPALIVKSAILSNTPNIIVLHNHPSGNVSPSFADKDVNEKIDYTCKMTGLKMLDHIIIGGDLCYSFKTDAAMLTVSYMAEDICNKKVKEVENLADVVEKYFITPAKNGFTYADRINEGYQMLDLISEDLDRITDYKLNIQKSLKQLAKTEGIGEKRNIQKMNMLGKAR